MAKVIGHKRGKLCHANMVCARGFESTKIILVHGTICMPCHIPEASDLWCESRKSYRPLVIHKRVAGKRLDSSCESYYLSNLLGVVLSLYSSARTLYKNLRITCVQSRDHTIT